MAIEPKPVSRPRRRYLRLSMCAMIVLVLMIGAGLGWFVRSAAFSARRWRRSHAPGAVSFMTGNGTTEERFEAESPGAESGSSI